MSIDHALILLGLLVLVMVVLVVRGVEGRSTGERRIVEPVIPYPNNHHVMGVGYYHATHQCWHRYPWNEFREDRGYFWDGQWHNVPDERQVSTSVPHLAEIERVNRVWREEGRRAADFWEDVDRFGFGTAIGRRTGS